MAGLLTTHGSRGALDAYNLAFILALILFASFIVYAAAKGFIKPELWKGIAAGMFPPIRFFG